MGVIAAVVILVGLAVPFVRTARDAKNSFGVARDRGLGIRLYHSVDPEFIMFGDVDDPVPFEFFGFDPEWGNSETLYW